MKNINYLFVFFLVCGSFIACNPEKKLAELVYFNQDSGAAAKTVQKVQPTIKPGDRLSIVVNALNPESTAPYNLGAGISQNNFGFLVDEDGTIKFPQLGKIYVAGKTMKEVAGVLTESLKKFVTDPILTIQFLNYKVTFLGEVGARGPLLIPEGKINIIEAIGLAGDLTMEARRDNILVIRENNGEREFGHINLLSKNVFNSPYYILQQNDVVYVEMNKAKAASSGGQLFIRNLGIATSLISFLTTIFFIISR